MNPLRLRLFAPLRGCLYPDDAEIGDLPMLFLVYLGFLLLPLALSRTMPWAPTVLALVLFLPLYFWGWWRPPQLPLLACALATLSLALTPLNPGASTFAIFALAQASEIRSFKLAFGLLLAIMLSYCGLIWWQGMPWVVAMTMVIPGIAVWFGNRSFRDAQRRRAVLKLSQEEVRRLGELAERERIARDLHDLLGHTLSVIVLKSELARKLMQRAPERALTEITEVEALARRSLDEVRQTLRGIRRASLEQEYAQSRLALEAAGIRSQFSRPDLALPPEVESALAFAVREAITNVVRHANASQLAMQLETQGERVVLEILDNGRGGVAQHGQGLTGMAERIGQLKGRLEVESPRGRGTRLRIELPLPGLADPDHGAVWQTAAI